MYQSGRAGDEAKKRKSPAKSGRVGITVVGTTHRKPECLKMRRMYSNLLFDFRGILKLNAHH